MSKETLEEARRLLLNAPYDRSSADEAWLTENIAAALDTAREQGRAEKKNKYTINYEDICYLSREFLRYNSLYFPQNQRINEWLKGHIAAARSRKENGE